jgi:hypothetical protein
MSSTGILPADTKVEANGDPSAHIIADSGSREASLPIPDAGQPEVAQVDASQPSELPHTNTTTLSLPDSHGPVLDDVTPSVPDEHPQLGLPTASSNFGFGPMQVDAPFRPTSTQPAFGRAASVEAAAVAEEVDPTLRLSIPPSTPTPTLSLGSEWSYSFADGAMRYEDTATDVYSNPMAHYAGNQPNYRTYSDMAAF